MRRAGKIVDEHNPGQSLVPLVLASLLELLFVAEVGTTVFTRMRLANKDIDKLHAVTILCVELLEGWNSTRSDRSGEAAKAQHNWLTVQGTQAHTITGSGRQFEIGCQLTWLNSSAAKRPPQIHK
jgi:hypothetical protein